MTSQSPNHRTNKPSSRDKTYYSSRLRLSSSPIDSSRESRYSPRRRSSPLAKSEEESYSTLKKKIPSKMAPRHRDNQGHDAKGNESSKTVFETSKSSKAKEKPRASDSSERSTKNEDKPFCGPDSGVKFDRKELKKITIDIIRTSCKTAKPIIQRDIINPETITIVRRPDEGKRPIFARPELMVSSKDDDNEEKRRLGTRGSIETESRNKSELTDPTQSSSSYHRKSKDRSPYERKRHRSRTPYDDRRSKHYSNEERYTSELKRSEKRNYSKERSREDSLGREKKEEKYVLESHGSNRTKSESSKSRPPRKRSPSLSRGDHKRKRSYEYERKSDEVSRRSREREEKKPRKEGSRDKYRGDNLESYGHEDYNKERRLARTSGMGEQSSCGVIPLHPLPPRQIPPGAWPMQPILAPHFRPMPIPYMVQRPGFRPPPHHLPPMPYPRRFYNPY